MEVPHSLEKYNSFDATNGALFFLQVAIYICKLSQLFFTETQYIHQSSQ